MSTFLAIDRTPLLLICQFSYWPYTCITVRYLVILGTENNCLFVSFVKSKYAELSVVHVLFIHVCPSVIFFYHRNNKLCKCPCQQSFQLSAVHQLSDYAMLMFICASVVLQQRKYLCKVTISILPQIAKLWQYC